MNIQEDQIIGELGVRLKIWGDYSKSAKLES
jgi:hypothetical protein